MKKVILSCLAVLIVAGVITAIYTGSFETADADISSSCAEETEICSEIKEKIVVYDDDGAVSDIDSVDSDSYEGFLFSAEGDVDLSDSVRYVGDNLYAADSLEDIEMSCDASDIGYIEPDYEFELLGTVTPLPYEPDEDDDDFSLLGSWSVNPDDKYYKAGKMYNMKLEDVPGAWEYNIYGQADRKVTVAVIDSGIYTGHEDIDYTHILKGKSYIEGSSTYDNYSHGTMVTGIIMASQNNSKGVAGCAPGVYVMPLKVFNSKGKSDGESIFKAIYAAVDAGVDVINMSLGTKNYSYTFKTACEKADSAGIIMVAAAGNNGDSTVEYPAAFDCVIGVGSVGQDGKRSPFSEMGKSVDVAAAGEGLYGVYNSKKTPYAICNGTSFACPQVAALAAMVKSVDKSYTNAKFLNLLKNTSSNYSEQNGPSWNKNTGYGIVNFRKVIETVLSVYIDLEDAEITLDSTRIAWDGTLKKPEVTVKSGNKTLVKGTDYTVAYKDNADIGIAKVIITGKGKTRGCVYVEFEIFDPYAEVTAVTDSGGKSSVSDGQLSGMLSQIKSGEYLYGKVKVPASDIDISLKKTFLTEISSYGLKLSSQTGSVTYGSDELSSVISQISGDTVTFILMADGTYDVTAAGQPVQGTDELLCSNESSVELSAEIALVIPESLRGKTLCAVDGNGNPYYGSTVGDEFRFKASGAGEYTLSSADSFAVKKASSVNLKTAASKNSSTKAKVKISGDVTNLKNMGYTVKYKYYCSTSKTKGYSLKKTTTSSSYTYTGLKKGKTYYFKVRAAVIDSSGKTVAQTKYSSVSKIKL